MILLVSQCVSCTLLEEQKEAEIKALVYCTLRTKLPLVNINWLNSYSFGNRSLDD